MTEDTRLIDKTPGPSGPSHHFMDGLTAIAVTMAVLGLAILASGLIRLEQYPWAQDLQPSEIVWLGLLVFQAAVVGLTLAAAALIWKGQSVLGLTKLRRDWVAPLLVTAAILATTSLLAYIFFWEIVQKDLQLFQKLMAGTSLWFPLLALCIGAPLSEELLFRGLLLQRLARTPLGFWGAALISNAGWTALHAGYSWISLADVFIAGLLFSWALWRTGSLWVPIAFHAIYNTIVFLFLLGPMGEPATPALGRMLYF